MNTRTSFSSLQFLAAICLALVCVVARGNQAPVVWISSPVNEYEELSAPASLTLTAGASDSDGTVSRVDFYQGSTLLGTATSNPYSISWNNVAAGRYALTAKATDNGGAVTTSGVVNITINGATVNGFQDRHYYTDWSTIPYRLFFPPNYNPATKYPIVMFLHGIGEAGTDNLAQISNNCNGAGVFVSPANQAAFPCFMVCPQSGDGWWNGAGDQVGILKKLQGKYSIDLDRTYITGLSAGGYNTWATLIANPDMFAAAAPICGGADSGGELLTNIPIWNFHCADDGTVAVWRSDNIIAAIRAAGGNPIFTRYDTGGHGAWGPAYANAKLVPWMMAQRRHVPATNSPLLTITSPTAQPTFATNSSTINLSGTAIDSSTLVTQVTWTNSAGGSGTASGTSNWSISNIPLTAGDNLIQVIASGTSYSAPNGGATTFNDTIKVTYSAGSVNTAPTISSVANQSILVNGSTGAQPFTVGDAETAAASLSVSGTSSNTALLPNSNIVLGGSGSNRTVTLTPAGNQTGTATITLAVSDGSNSTSTSFSLTVSPNTPPPPPPPPASNGTGNGINAEYYNSVDLTGPALRRVEQNINFSWGAGSPDASIHNDSFSARWSGQILPRYSQVYTFSTQSDDGVRLWVNGQLVVDNWTMHPDTTNTGTIALEGGRLYAIKMEYYEMSGYADASLSWSSGSQAKEIVPQSQLFTNGNGLSAEYFNSVDLSGPALRRIDPSVNFAWGSGSPDASIRSDGFSARWSGQVMPRYTEVYTFSTLSDDGVRLWVNGQQLINNWTNHPDMTDSGTITLVAGKLYDIKMEYFEATGFADAALSWSSTSQANEIIPQSQLFSYGNGLVAEYFNTMDLTGSALRRIDQTVNFDWGYGSPDPAIHNTGFSARWTGMVVPRFSENYTFSTTSDDGVRLWVNNQLVIDNWTDHPATTNSANVTLQANRMYSIKMEFYQNSGASSAKLLWSSASQSQEIIPQSQLYTSGNGLNGAYYNSTDMSGSALIRTDATVNFDWGYGSPDPAIHNTGFSVRWTGSVLPRYSETYTFSTTSDDGVRLWVNNQLLVDNWGDHPATTNSGAITLQANTLYDIRMDFYQNSGASVAKLLWSSASQSLEIVPQSQLYSQILPGAQPKDIATDAVAPDAVAEPAVAPAPTVVSGANVSGNAVAGQSVNLSVAAAGDANTTYTWNFGDGSTATGATVTHTYAASGSYDASVVITNSNGGSTTSNVSVAVGTSLPIQIKKILVKLNFMKAGSDNISITGTLPETAGINPTGKQVVVDLGGVVKSFTLNSKGQANSGGNVFKLNNKGKTKGTGSFQVMLKNGAYQAQLANAGLQNVDTRSQAKVIKLTITLDQKNYSNDVKTIYTSVKNHMGLAK